MTSLYSHIEESLLGEYAPGRRRPLSINVDNHCSPTLSLTVIHEEQHQELALTTPYGLLQYYAVHLYQADCPIVSKELVNRLFAASTITHETWALFCEEYLGGLFGLTPSGNIGLESMYLEYVRVIIAQLPSELLVFKFFIVRALMDFCMSADLAPADVRHGANMTLISRVLAKRSAHPDWRLVCISTRFEESHSYVNQLRLELFRALPRVQERADQLGVSLRDFVVDCFRKRDHVANFEYIDQVIGRPAYRSFAMAMGDAREKRRDDCDLSRFSIATKERYPELNLQARVIGAESDLESALTLYDINYQKHFSVATVAIDNDVNQPSAELTATVAKYLNGSRLGELSWYCISDFPAWRWLGFQRHADRGAPQPMVQILTPSRVNLGRVAESLGARFLGSCVAASLAPGDYFEYAVNMSHSAGFSGIFYAAETLRVSRESLLLMRDLGIDLLSIVMETQYAQFLLTEIDEVRIVLELPLVLYGILAHYDTELFDWLRSAVAPKPGFFLVDSWANLTAWLASEGALTSLTADD